MTVISASWIVLGLLVALAVYRQLRSYQQLGRSFRAFATSHERLVDHLDAAIRSLEDMVSERLTSQREQAVVTPPSLIEAVPAPLEGREQAARVAVTHPALMEAVAEEDTWKAGQQASDQFMIDVPVFANLTGLFSEDWSGTVAENQISVFVKRFLDKIQKKQSKGDVLLTFAYAVLSVIGKSNRLNNAQKTVINRLCSVIKERLSPIMLWADFVRARLDEPETVKRILILSCRNAVRLPKRIQRVMKNASEKLNLTENRPILVAGYSATAVSALGGLLEGVLKNLKILTLESWPDRQAKEGMLLKRDLNEYYTIPEKNIEVVKVEIALKRLKQGEPQLVLMGCKVIGMRKTKELEIVNAHNALEFAEAATQAGIPVAVIGGFFKCWPTTTYERYRPGIVIDKTSDIIPANFSNWIITEDGLLARTEFQDKYEKLFDASGIPFAAIRECKKQQMLKLMASRMDEIVADLEHKGAGPQDLHMVEAIRSQFMNIVKVEVKGSGVDEDQALENMLLKVDAAKRNVPEIEAILPQIKEIKEEEYLANTKDIISQIGEMGAKESDLMDLPEHFLKAQRHYEKKKKDEKWLQDHLGKYVSIIETHVEGPFETFEELASTARKKYGYGPLFMTQVVEDEPVEYLGPQL